MIYSRHKFGLGRHSRRSESHLTSFISNNMYKNDRNEIIHLNKMVVIGGINSN